MFKSYNMRYTFPKILCFCLILFVSCTDSTKQSIDENRVSGAYEAMLFHGNRMAYPNANFPADGYTRAWEKLQKQDFLQKSNVPPYETVGPLNRAGRMLTMAINPLNSNSLLAGSASGGLWKSTSAGEGLNAWERVELGFPVLAVSCISYAENDSMTIYIGTGEVYNHQEAGTGAAYRNTRGSWGMGILKSEDGGKTWKKSLDWSYNQQHGIWAIKAINPDLVYAATTDGVYLTEDKGESWNQILDIKMATDLVVNSGEILVGCGNFQTEGFGIYKSSDLGSTWKKIDQNLPTTFKGKIQFGQAPLTGKIVYASIGNGFSSADGATWLCRTSDFGDNWEIVNTFDYSKWQGWFAHNVDVSPNNNDEIIAIGIEAHRSTDGGVTFTDISDGGVGNSNPPLEGPDGGSNFIHSDAHDVRFDPNDNNTIYVINDGGIHKSVNSGFDWHSANGGFQTAQFYNGTTVSLANESTYLGGLQDNGTILWNKDLSWTRVNGGDGSWTAADPLDENILYASSQFLNVRKSTNAGASFSGIGNTGASNNRSFIAPFVVAPSNGQVLYFGSSLITKTIDQTETYTTLNNGNELDGNPALAMAISSVDEDILYVATAPYLSNRGHVFVTTNGDEFEDITQDLPDRYPMDMHVDFINDAVAYVVYSGFGSGHVFKTEDYGQNWLDITANLPDIPTNTVITDPLYPDHIYVGNDFGVFLSIDGGVSWEPFMEGMPEVAMVFDLQIAHNQRKLRVATHGNGAYERDLFQNIDSNVSETEDNTFRVFPNPSLGSFQIELKEAINGDCTVQLYSMNGHLVKEETLNVQGKISELMNFKEVPAGSYMFLIEQNNMRMSQQVTIVK